MVVVDGGVNGSKKACNLHPQDRVTSVIIIIIIIINRLYTGYLRLCAETFCVCRVYSVAAIL